MININWEKAFLENKKKKNPVWNIKQTYLIFIVFSLIINEM